MDGQSLTWDVTKRTLLDSQPRKPEVEFTQYGKWLSLDGKRLIERERDAETEVYSYVAGDPKTRKEVYRIDPRKSDLGAFVETLVFRPDGKAFLLHNAEGFPFFRRGRSGDYSLYDTETGRPTLTLKLEGVGGIGAAFSPDGSRLFLVTDRPRGRKRNLELIAFDIKTGQPVQRASRPGRTAKVWALSDNRSALVLSEVLIDAVTSKYQLWTWNSELGKVKSEWKCDDNLWSSLALVPTEVLSPDRRLLGLLTYRSGPPGKELVSARVLDTNTLTECANFALPPISTWALGGLGTGEYPSLLTFSPDNRTLAVGFATGVILLYDIKPTGKTNPK